jgi:hypothetical protein
MVSCRRLIVAGLICQLLCGCEPTAQRHDSISPQWGTEANGLRIAVVPSASLEPSAVSCAFDLYFQNVGADDTILYLGTMLEKGRVYYPHAVGLSLFDLEGNARRLEFPFKAPEALNDRVEVFSVPLPSGSMYSVRVNIADYYCPDTGEYFIDLPEGEYRVFANFEGQTVQDTGAAEPNAPSTSVNFWQGKVQSNVTRFLVSRQQS